MILLEMNHLQATTGAILMLLFIVFFFFLLSFIKGKLWKVIFSLLTSIFINSQISSIYSTREFIGYKFVIHSTISGSVGLYQLFFKEMIIATLLISSLFLLFYNSNRLFDKIKTKIKNKQRVNLIRFWGLIIPLLTITAEGSFYNDTKTLFTLLAPRQSENFTDALQKAGMSDYTMPNDVKCNGGGKNIIILSLESYEKGYLSKKYAHLTPNLTQLKNKWNAYDLKLNSGSSWTMSSLYTYLTGFPGFWGIKGNDIFHTASYSKISSILNVLHRLNYQTVYLNGNTNSTGTRDLLTFFNFDEIIDYRNCGKLEEKSPYGIRDKDLFEIAKKKTELLNQQNKPFALFVSTTDTHWPNGFYDKRMESVISPKKSNLEFMVAAVDYMIGDFIRFLEKNKMLDNTIVYIFPDHYKMGDPSMFDDTGERGLFLLTNSDSTKINHQPIYQIDLPNILLNGAEIKHNLKFLTNYIDGDKEQYIKQNMKKITDINVNGIILKN